MTNKNQERDKERKLIVKVRRSLITINKISDKHDCSVLEIMAMGKCLNSAWLR